MILKNVLNFFLQHVFKWAMCHSTVRNRLTLPAQEIQTDQEKETEEKHPALQT